MSIKNISATNVKLISVTDLRPIDFQSGKRLAIPVSECNVCDRCQALHVKVYEVEADGVVYNVGSGCCRKMFGWEPAKEVVLTAEKVAKDRAVQAALMTVAQPVIDQVNAIPVPSLKYYSFRWTCFGYDYLWTLPENIHCGIRVESGKGTILPVSEITLKDADLARWARIWRNKQVKEIVATLGYEEKKAKKLAFAICELIAA